MVRRELCPPYERAMIAAILASLKTRNITVLRGLRRTGKSTLLYQSIRQLLSEKISPESILYFSFDDEKGTVQDLLDEYSDSVLGKPLNSSKRLYIFLDEIQKCNDWAEQVKRNYDLYPNIKFVLSGSVSFDLGARSAESLVGRTAELILFPLSFAEYLNLKGLDTPGFGEPLKSFLMAERRLRPHFNHFLMTGGLPELVQENDHKRVRDYVESSLIRRAVYGDLFQLGGIGDPESMLALVKAIGGFPGILLNYDRLGSDIGKDRRTVSSYISRLEYSMIIRTLGNLRAGGLTSSRKLRKAYPVSSALTFAFKGPDLDERDMGRVVETAVLNEINADHYWRYRGYEVDFVHGSKGETAIEVKLGKKRKLDFGQYDKMHKIKHAFLMTRNETGEGKVDQIKYKMIPAWALCAGAGIRNIRVEK